MRESERWREGVSEEESERASERTSSARATTTIARGPNDRGVRARVFRPSGGAGVHVQHAARVAQSAGDTTASDETAGDGATATAGGRKRARAANRHGPSSHGNGMGWDLTARAAARGGALLAARARRQCSAEDRVGAAGGATVLPRLQYLLDVLDHDVLDVVELDLDLREAVGVRVVVVELHLLLQDRRELLVEGERDRRLDRLAVLPPFGGTSGPPPPPPPPPSPPPSRRVCARCAPNNRVRARAREREEQRGTGRETTTETRRVGSPQFPPRHVKAQSAVSRPERTISGATCEEGAPPCASELCA